MATRPGMIVLMCGCLAGVGLAGAGPADRALLHGTVRDADGKPIAGAVVTLSGTTGAVKKKPARTGSDGKYTLAAQIEPGVTVEVTRLSVEARGFIRFDEEFVARPLSLRAGKEVELDFVLAAGEVLAGRVDVPLTRAEHRAGTQDRLFGFVRGPSFKQFFITDPGGTFEVWVPKGRYTVELFGQPGWPPIRLEQVPSGSRDLKLTLVEAAVPEATLARAFDALWEDMDRHYSYFELKKVDWRELRERFRPRAVKAGTMRQFVSVLEEMLANLRDGHVWIEWSGETIVPHDAPPPPENYNRRVTLSTLEGLTSCGEFAVVGKTKGDGFGAFVLIRQVKADQASVAKAVEVIRALRDVPGFLVDLRSAGGGNELLAQEIARQFCGQDAVYAKSKYRDGPGHNDFGRTYERVLKAANEPFLKPVVCLIGPRCVSSGEAFAQMMKCLPHVTMIGARTRGSTGNPRPFQLPGIEVTVYYSRWVAMMPDGTPVEGTGVAPAVELNFPANAYADRDPTWEKALELLRKRVSQ